MDQQIVVLEYKDKRTELIVTREYIETLQLPVFWNNYTKTQKRHQVSNIVSIERIGQQHGVYILHLSDGNTDRILLRERDPEKRAAVGDALYSVLT